jgi:tetratricopeptide (TPR) repeat protein
MNIFTNISELEQTGLIRRAQTVPELEYLFRHALVQEAAYDSILKADRKNLHIAVAREMERIYPERLDELAALLAGHYREAGETQKAYEYFKRAAQHAFDKFANSEAEYNLRAALELGVGEMERAELNLQLGLVLSVLARLDEAEKYLRAALADYRAREEREQLALIYSTLAQNYWAAGNSSQMLALAREGLQEIGEMPPNENYADLFRCAATGCIFTDQVAEAQAYVDRALTIAKACGAKGALSQALTTQALIENRRGKNEQTIATLETAIVYAEESKNYAALARARNNLAYVYGSLGKNLEAAAQYKFMVELNHNRNSISGELWFLTQLNSLYLDLGKMDEARAFIANIEDLLQASGGKAHRQMAILSRLQTLIYSGHCAGTVAELTATRDQCLAIGEKQLIMNLSNTLALAYSLMKDHDRAAQEMKLGIDAAGVWGGAFFRYLLAAAQARSSMELSVAQKTLEQADQTIKGEPGFANKTARLYALMHLRARAENFDEALDVAAELAEAHRVKRYRWLYALVLWDAGGIALKANAKAQAKELLQKAANEYAEMNIPIYAEKLNALLGDL